MATVAPVVHAETILLDTGSTQVFGKMCRRVLAFLAGPPALLVVTGPTGCGKLTAAQHCVTAAGLGLVEIVNESAAATRVVSEIKRSGNMLVATGDCKASALVITGADGMQSGYASLLDCARACGKHVIVIVNNAAPFATAKAAELHRCSWNRPWSSDALMATLNAVPDSGLLTVQEKGALIRHCSDMRQLKTAVEMLVMAKRQGCDTSSALHAVMDTPVHQWFNALAIMKGGRLEASCHDLNWLAGSYLGGLHSLGGAAEFASNLAVVDMLQQSEQSDFPGLVLQSSVPLVSHQNGLQIKRLSLESMPRANKRARYSMVLES